MSGGKRCWQEGGERWWDNHLVLGYPGLSQFGTGSPVLWGCPAVLTESPGQPGQLLMPCPARLLSRPRGKEVVLNSSSQAWLPLERPQRLENIPASFTSGDLVGVTQG